jgi:hypothetical protein
MLHSLSYSRWLTKTAKLPNSGRILGKLPKINGLIKFHGNFSRAEAGSRLKKREDVFPLLVA